MPCPLARLVSRPQQSSVRHIAGSLWRDSRRGSSSVRATSPRCANSRNPPPPAPFLPSRLAAAADLRPPCSWACDVSSSPPLLLGAAHQSTAQASRCYKQLEAGTHACMHAHTHTCSHSSRNPSPLMPLAEQRNPTPQLPAPAPAAPRPCAPPCARNALLPPRQNTTPLLTCAVPSLPLLWPHATQDHHGVPSQPLLKNTARTAK